MRGERVFLIDDEDWAHLSEAARCCIRLEQPLSAFFCSLNFVCWCDARCWLGFDIFARISVCSLKKIHEELCDLIKSELVPIDHESF
jgi:predicted glycosyltransferase involved in capsule biosynthesis